MFCRLPRVVGLLVLAVAVVALCLQGARPAYAALSATKTCTGSGGNTAVVGESITCTLTITASATTDLPAGTTVTVTATGNNYQFTAATCAATPGTATCTVSPLPAVLVVTCATDACATLTVTETMLVTSATPATVTQQVSFSTGAPTITVVAAGFTLLPAFGQVFVSTTGDDANNCQTRPTACRTLNRAMEVARDSDTVVVLPGTYAIEETVRVRRLVTIQPDSNARVTLRIKRGVTGFEVTAQGGPMLHAIIRNFTIGGNFQDGSSAAIFSLITDSYTEIANNIIGGDDLRINNGVVIGNSLNPNIHDNTFIGSTSPFATSPLLVVGRTISGFGVVSLECLGVLGYSVSSRVMIRTNAFTGGWTAGVWLCSDGAGEHRIETNVFRNYYRGLALKDVTNTLVADNQLIGGLADGIILYGASLRNRISRNHIESHIAPGAAGIRVGWIADPLLPLDNLVTENHLLRDTIGVYVFGARSTQITKNEIKISGIRTGILLSPATFLNDPATQPRDTLVTENVVVFTGACGPFFGCALRLLGVTVPVNAVNNDWGLRFALDVEGNIYHQVDEILLGLVTFVPFTNMAATPSPSPGTAGSSTPGSPSPTPANPTGPSTASGPTTTSAAPVRTVTLNSGCTQMTWPGVSGLSVVDASQSVTPASAQRGVVIWRRSASGQWESYSVDRPLASNQVFFLVRGDPIAICVRESATWTIVLEMVE